MTVPARETLVAHADRAGRAAGHRGYDRDPDHARVADVLFRGDDDVDRIVRRHRRTAGCRGTVRCRWCPAVARQQVACHPRMEEAVLRPASAALLPAGDSPSLERTAPHRRVRGRECLQHQTPAALLKMDRRDCLGVTDHGRDEMGDDVRSCTDLYHDGVNWRHDCVSVLGSNGAVRRVGNSCVSAESLRADQHTPMQSTGGR